MPFRSYVLGDFRRLHKYVSDCLFKIGKGHLVFRNSVATKTMTGVEFNSEFSYGFQLKIEYFNSGQHLIFFRLSDVITSWVQASGNLLMGTTSGTSSYSTSPILLSNVDQSSNWIVLFGTKIEDMWFFYAEDGSVTS